MSAAIQATAEGHLKDLPDEDLAGYAEMTAAYAGDFAREMARRELAPEASRG